MGRITRGPGGGRGSQPRRGGRAGMGWGWGTLRQRREPGREEGTGGLPCGTLGAAAPWPGVADPGGGLGPGRAGQPREAALVARVVRGCAAGRAGRRGGGAGRDRARPGGGAEGGLRAGAGIGSVRGKERGSGEKRRESLWADANSREDLVVV